VLAAMNVCFYESVARLPLGIAVTIELFGPARPRGVALP
jgi:threonine/homoserine efflux transporter RhtA